MAAKRIQEIGDFQATNFTAQTAVGITASVDQSNIQTGALLVVLAKFTGAITNTDIQISVGLSDENGIEVWSAPQSLTLRTLPGGAVVADMAVFSVFRSQHVRIALESAITGGGTVALYWATAV
jgi:hypothetical protein